MKLELFTHTDNEGLFTKQFLKVNDSIYEIKGYDVWKDDNIKIGNKLYNLKFKGCLNGVLSNEKIYQYELLKIEELEMIDISNEVMDILGKDTYYKDFM